MEGRMFGKALNLTHDAYECLTGNEKLQAELQAIWIEPTDEKAYYGDAPDEFKAIVEPKGKDAGFDTSDDYGGVFLMLPLMSDKSYSSPQQLIDEYRNRILNSSLGKYNDLFTEANLTDAYIAGNIVSVHGFISEMKAPRHVRAKFKTVRDLFKRSSSLVIMDNDNNKAIAIAADEESISDFNIIGPTPVEIEKIILKEGEKASDVVPESYNDRYVTSIVAAPIPIIEELLYAILSAVLDTKDENDDNQPVPNFPIAEGTFFVTINDNANSGDEDGFILIEKITTESLIRLMCGNDVVDTGTASYGDFVVYEPESDKEVAKPAEWTPEREVDYIESSSPMLLDIAMAFNDGKLVFGEDSMTTVEPMLSVTLK